MRSLPTMVALCVLASLTVSPAASAAGGGEIRVAEHRVGDRWTLAIEAAHVGAAPGPYDRGTVVFHVEGEDEALDGHAVMRPTTRVRFDWLAEDHVHSQSACHLLRGGIEEVRQDFLYIVDFGRPVRPLLPLVGYLPAQIGDLDIQYETFVLENCDVGVDLGGLVLREGDRLPSERVRGSWRWDMGGPFRWSTWRGVVPLSEPAERVDFHGRPALQFTFRLDGEPAERLARGFEGTFRVVLADGLPGVVRAEYEGVNATGARYRELTEVAAFAPGKGAPLRDEGARLPAQSPHGEMVPFDPRRVDDAPYAPAYSFDEAWRALREDPRLGVGAWLDAHPDAWIASADFAEHDPMTDGQDGMWWLTLADGDEGIYVQSSRLAPAGALGVPEALRVTLNERYDTVRPYWPSTPPERVLDHDALLAVASAYGVPPANARYVAWWFAPLEPDDVVPRHFFLAGDGGAPAHPVDVLDGRYVFIDAETGRLFMVMHIGYHGTAVPAIPPPIGLAARGPAPAPGMSGPSGGLAAAAAVAGVAALGGLVLLARLVLAPLYTRLRRDALLAQPARARLYDRIRAEPGVHQSELIVASGLGNGGTRHHLEKLAKQGLVFAIAEGPTTRYYATGSVDPRAARADVALRTGRAREVRDLYAREPHLSLREAAARLGMAPAAVHRVKRRLEEKGLLPAAPAEVVS